MVCDSNFSLLVYWLYLCRDVEGEGMMRMGTMDGMEGCSAFKSLDEVSRERGEGVRKNRVSTRDRNKKIVVNVWVSHRIVSIWVIDVQIVA